MYERSFLCDDGCVFLCSRFLTPFSQTSCLHTSTALNTKNWERKNRILYPPQENDEPRRPAVSDTSFFFFFFFAVLKRFELFIYLFIYILLFFVTCFFSSFFPPTQEIFHCRRQIKYSKDKMWYLAKLVRNTAGHPKHIFSYVFSSA